MLLVLISLILSSVLLSSCVSSTTQRTVPDTQFMFFVPDKVPRPNKPVFEAYNPKVGMDDRGNFAKLQRNTLRSVEYEKALNDTCGYYEKQIDQFNLKKEELTKQDATKKE